MYEPSPKRNLKRSIAITGLLSVIIIGAWPIVNKLNAVPYTILVNGKPVVNVESMHAAKGVLDSIRHERASGVPNDSIRFSQEVTLRRASKDVEIAEVPEAMRDIEKLVAVEAELYAINVDGEPVVAFVDRGNADETLRLIKSHYETKLSDRHVESTFKGNVLVVKRYVPVEKLRATSNEAVEFLTSTSEPETVHVMELGERVSRLAQKYHVSLDDLKKLNPDKDLNRVVEGDRLIMRPARTPVTVISKALITKTEEVDPPSRGRYRRPMKSGKRQMQLMATYENGQPAHEELISQITTWDRPKSQPDDETEKRFSTKRHYRHRSSRHRSKSPDADVQAVGSDSGL